MRNKYSNLFRLQTQICHLSKKESPTSRLSLSKKKKKKKELLSSSFSSFIPQNGTSLINITYIHIFEITQNIKLKTMRTTNLTSLYTQILQKKKPPKPLSLSLFSSQKKKKKTKTLSTSQNFSVFVSNMEGLYEQTLLSHSRDAAVPMVSAQTIKPFNAHSSRFGPELHSGAAAAFSGRRRRRRRRC